MTEAARNYQTIGLTEEGGVAGVVLNRPEVHNAFNATMIAELTAAFGTIAGRDDIRAVVLSGQGRSFCAGADAAWMSESLELTRQENVEDALRMSDMFAAIDELPQPVVGRVHGAALGGGMGLLAVCDLVVASGETRFGFTEAKLGIVPAVISRFVVPKIGQSWSRALFTTAQRLDADTARSIGLVHHVVGSNDLDDKVSAVVNELKSSGPVAAREAKRLVAALVSCPEQERRRLTAETIARLRTSEEGQEGLRAFLEKRDAGWRR